MTIALSNIRPSRSARRTSPTVSDIFALWKQRRDLANLPADRLFDLGLTTADVAQEASRPLWDLPAHWRR